MKYLITYNESVRDKMIGKSDKYDEWKKTVPGIANELEDFLKVKVNEFDTDNIKMLFISSNIPDKIIIDWFKDKTSKYDITINHFFGDTQVKLKKLMNESVRDMMTPKSDEEIEQAAINNNDIPNMKILKGAKYGLLSMVKQSLKEGADIHGNDDLPLKYASENGHIEIVKYLLDEGKFLDSNNKWAISVTNDMAIRRSIELATENNHMEVVELLKQYLKPGGYKTTKDKIKKLIYGFNESVRDKMTPISDEDFMERLKKGKTEEGLKLFLRLMKGVEKIFKENDMEYTAEFQNIPSSIGKDDSATVVYRIKKSKSLDNLIYPREAHIYMNEHYMELQMWNGTTYRITNYKNLKDLKNLLMEQGFISNQ